MCYFYKAMKKFCSSLNQATLFVIPSKESRRENPAFKAVKILFCGKPKRNLFRLTN